MLVTIRVENVRNSAGLIACALFDRAQDFPSNRLAACHGEATPATSGTLEFVFEGVKPGRYAVSVLHDENSNGRMDTNLLGMPREGYGVSNNAVRRFGPPRFDDAAIDLQPGDAISIRLRYP